MDQRNERDRGLIVEEIEEWWIFPLKFVPVERKEDAENEEINKL